MSRRRAISRFFRGALALLIPWFPTRSWAAEVWLRPFAYVIDEIDAAPDGRAYIVGDHGHGYVIGPADRVSVWRGDAPEWAHQARPSSLKLANDGTIESRVTGARASLPEPLLRALGPKDARRVLVFDAESKLHVLVRSRRNGPGTIAGWSVVRFTEERVVDEDRIPFPSWVSDWDGEPPLVAAGGGAVWIALRGIVLRLDGGRWTTFLDDESQRDAQERRGKDDRAIALGITAFTLGNAASATALSVPISLTTHDRLAPTASITFAGSLVGLVPAAALGAISRPGSGALGGFTRGLGLVLGVATTPLVALTTYGTGELGFRGTEDAGLLGALGGAYAGAAVWTALAAPLLGKDGDGWWYALPIGSALISAASTTGYLWAGDGLKR